MSVRKRVEQIANQVASGVAYNLADIKQKQVQRNLSSLGQVIGTDGTSITVKLDDGTEQTVTAFGNRTLGTGDVGLIVNGIII